MARRLRGAKSFRRAEPIREAYAFVLVVCEGTKSEPNYFKRLRHVYRLSSANVVITPANGNDPISIVEFAKCQLETKNYDRVYCVFDRNGHHNYVKAIQRLSQINHIVAIPSEPCFEVWVLLHFVYSTAPFKPIGADSGCAMVIKEVQKHFPKYAKGYDSVFDDLEASMDQAIKHATQLSTHNDKVGSTNPATKVHMLVECLKNLRM
jgi:RloB-like protein